MDEYPNFIQDAESRTMLPTGIRVKVLGTAEYDETVHEWGSSIEGIIDGYTLLVGPGGTHVYYVVLLDEEDQGWLGHKRTYISRMVVHPTSLKVVR